MKKSFLISVPKPCSQDWEKMAVSSQGKFCESCQRHLIDFTQKSPREIQEIVTADARICGRFRNDQLTGEPINSERSGFFHQIFFRQGFLASLLLSFSAMFFGCSDDKAKVQQPDAVDAEADIVPKHTLGVPIPERMRQENLPLADTVEAPVTSQKNHQSKS